MLGNIQLSLSLSLAIYSWVVWWNWAGMCLSVNKYSDILFDQATMKCAGVTSAYIDECFTSIGKFFSPICLTSAFLHFIENICFLRISEAERKIAHKLWSVWSVIVLCIFFDQINFGKYSTFFFLSPILNAQHPYIYPSQSQFGSFKMGPLCEYWSCIFPAQYSHSDPSLRLA